jgi:hypothetical protein
MIKKILSDRSCLRSEYKEHTLSPSPKLQNAPNTKSHGLSGWRTGKRGPKDDVTDMFGKKDFMAASENYPMGRAGIYRWTEFIGNLEDIRWRGMRGWVS